MSPLLFTDDLKIKPISKLHNQDGSTGGVAEINIKPIKMDVTM